MALSLVTFNIGGAKGTREEEKSLINKFFSDHLPSLLYLQESPWRRPYIKDHVAKISENYEVVTHGHLHATVFYRKDVLRDDGSGQLMELFRDHFKDKYYLDFVTFKERASFSKLTEIATERTFLAISWHGEHKITDKNKKEKFEDLLNVISNIHSSTKYPIVLGGDFNIDLDVVTDSIEDAGFEVYKYEPENRETVIDFFVVTPEVELSHVLALGGYMYHNEGNASTSFVPREEEERFTEHRSVQQPETKPQGIKAFDHDPVKAFVTFKRKEKYPVENVAEVTDKLNTINI